MASKRNGRPSEDVVTRSTVRPAVLVLLKERRSHGYELLERLEELGLKGDPGSLYRSLRLMEREKLLRSEWSDSGAGPPRRVYTLTARGEKTLEGLVPQLADEARKIGILLKRYKKAVDA